MIDLPAGATHKKTENQNASKEELFYERTEKIWN